MATQHVVQQAGNSLSVLSDKPVTSRQQWHSTNDSKNVPSVGRLLATETAATCVGQPVLSRSLAERISGWQHDNADSLDGRASSLSITSYSNKGLENNI